MWTSDDKIQFRIEGNPSWSLLVVPLDVPETTYDNMILCEGNLTEKKLFDSMITMPKNKYPGNDSLTIEFYQFFWHDKKNFHIKNVFKKKKKIRVSQKQSIAKLIEKRVRT